MACCCQIYSNVNVTIVDVFRRIYVETIAYYTSIRSGNRDQYVSISVWQQYYYNF